jgi:hypothetical protein
MEEDFLIINIEDKNILSITKDEEIQTENIITEEKSNCNQEIQTDIIVIKEQECQTEKEQYIPLGTIISLIIFGFILGRS